MMTLAASPTRRAGATVHHAADPDPLQVGDGQAVSVGPLYNDEARTLVGETTTQPGRLAKRSGDEHLGVFTEMSARATRWPCALNWWPGAPRSTVAHPRSETATRRG